MNEEKNDILLNIACTLEAKRHILSKINHNIVYLCYRIDLLIIILVVTLIMRYVGWI